MTQESEEPKSKATSVWERTNDTDGHHFSLIGNRPSTHVMRTRSEDEARQRVIDVARRCNISGFGLQFEHDLREALTFLDTIGGKRA